MDKLQIERILGQIILCIVNDCLYCSQAVCISQLESDRLVKFGRAHQRAPVHPVKLLIVSNRTGNLKCACHDCTGCFQSCLIRPDDLRII